MKNKNSTELVSIKTNDEIVDVLKKCHKHNLKYITLLLHKTNKKNQIQYALLVNKSQFKHSVVRNKIKRQLRSILISSNLKGNISILLKPNSLYMKENYENIKKTIIDSIEKYQNGK